MSHYKAHGEIISESRGPFLLQECIYQVFLSGLSYNKCKRLATAFKVKHVKTFLDLQEDKEEILEIVSNQITIKEYVSENYPR